MKNSYLIKNDGLSNIFMIFLMSVLALTIISSVYLSTSLYQQTSNENYMEKSSIAFYEWRKIAIKSTDEIRRQTCKTVVIDNSKINPNYKINIKYGNVETFDSKDYIPIEIKVEDKNKQIKPFILKRDFYFHKSSDSFVHNNSMNEIGMKWFSNEELLRFIADGNEIKEQGTTDFSDGNGYIIFDNGLMMQWGTLETNFDEKIHNIWFPKEFPNKCMTVITSVYQSHWIAGIRFNSIAGYTNAYASFIPAGGMGDYKIFWIAFGH